MKRISMCVMLLALSLGQMPQVHGAITIANYSFETPSVPTYSQPIDDWSASDVSNGTGVWKPATYPLAYGPTPVIPDGVQVGYISGNNSIAQQLAATAVAGANYTLSAAVGWRMDFGSLPPDMSIQLWAGGSVVNGLISGGTLLGSLSPTFLLTDFGVFHDVAFSVVAPNSVAGQNLGIVIVNNNSTGVQANFDNIGLTAVPEPATWMVWGGLCAVGAVIAYYRRSVAKCC